MPPINYTYMNLLKLISIILMYYCVTKLSHRPGLAILSYPGPGPGQMLIYDPGPGPG